MTPTKEMVDRFLVRTRRHIELVGRNLERLAGYVGIDRSELISRARLHDLSKFGERERAGYTWLTWIYHCKEQGRPFEVAPHMSREIERALTTHRRRNTHHPEAHLTPDAMSVADLAEMVCDWTAIAQEQSGTGSARPWAEANISRWSFSHAARDFIFLTIDELDRRNAYERAEAWQ